MARVRLSPLSTVSLGGYDGYGRPVATQVDAGTRFVGFTRCVGYVRFDQVLEAAVNRWVLPSLSVVTSKEKVPSSPVVVVPLATSSLLPPPSPPRK